jgi:hypothetical protein
MAAGCKPENAYQLQAIHPPAQPPARPRLTVLWALARVSVSSSLPPRASSSLPPRLLSLSLSFLECFRFFFLSLLLRLEECLSLPSRLRYRWQSGEKGGRG